MNTDQVFYPNHEDTFKEVEIRDMSDGNNIIYIPDKPTKLPENLTSAMSPIPIVGISERDIKFSQILQFGKFLKWVTLIEFLLIFTYLILGLAFLLFLLIFPILGFLAVKKLFKSLAVLYLIYLIGSFLLRVILMIAYGNVVFIVIGSFIVVFNLICIRYLVKFLKVSKELSAEERQELIILQNGVPLRSYQLNEQKG